ncbi:hypothetical protein HFN68_24235 [Rhizobium laguerreae]|uniref:terminase small subunit-like protein n=1 Tax=Rhizobium laguerreae TaxID=1076926 RepID=UPI001C909CEE|nr:hypothetical protein [Rhizobium laguerreae]MBY3535998.1 hypothetical protein [Rhizobium laguerreae]
MLNWLRGVRFVVCEMEEAKAFEPALKPSTVRQWVYDDVDGFAVRYAHARDLGIEAMVDEMFDIADDGSNDLMTIEKGDTAFRDREQGSYQSFEAPG